MDTGWDAGQVTFDRGAAQEVNEAHVELEMKFLDFIRNYRRDNAFIYRDQLKQNYNLGQFYLDVRIEDLSTYNEYLANELVNRPHEFLERFEAAAYQAVAQSTLRENDEAIHPIQVLINSAQNALPIRELNATHMSKLVRVPGIVVSASRTAAKASRVVIQCRGCGNRKSILVRGGFTGIEMPTYCDQPIPMPTKCPANPFSIQPDQCTFIDQQTLKLQESPENVPTGEMPRHMLIAVDRNLVGRAVPGTRITAIGIYTIYKGASAKQFGSVAIRHTYLQAMGISIDSEGGRSSEDYTAAEVHEFQEFARSANVYESIVANIAPSIWGHEDIKKAVACQLFGGCRKELPDGMKLRGDINVLLLGDPGTAKSQLLKFVEKVAPIAVYTSGKGSSAAGLTASVIRDPGSREFYLEGGAMVLADGGIVCIDEFDKMRIQDRVAIHEAMEQQTISIAKAGITTILNSRTAVLAAANPQFTVYDETRSTAENLSEFRSTILSRFDCIFLVRDARNHERDLTIARHVVKVHMRANIQSDSDAANEFPLMKLKRYIGYCKSKCEPRLSKEAAEILSNKYVSMRAAHRQREIMGSNSIPITVRQLEAIVRLSEALAKMRLSPVATEQHVEEAIRVFTVSTVDAINSGEVVLEQMNDTMRQEVENAEMMIKRRLAVGSRISERKLIDSIANQYDLSEKVVRKAIQVMVTRDELEYKSKAMNLLRKR